MSGNSPSVNPLSYAGILPNNPPNQIRNNRDPNSTDINANIGDEWENYSVNPSRFWKLANLYYNVATWIELGNEVDNLETLTGDDLNPVSVIANNINIFGNQPSATPPVLGAISFSHGSPSEGQLNAQVLVDGTSIEINASNQLSLVSGTLITTWIDQSISITGIAGNGYFITAPLTITLPPSPSQGNTIAFIVKGGTPFVILANTGQTIELGSSSSSSSGTATNTQPGDSMTLVYQTLSNGWTCWNSPTGAWTLA